MNCTICNAESDGLVDIHYMDAVVLPKQQYDPVDVLPLVSDKEVLNGKPVCFECWKNN